MMDPREKRPRVSDQSNNSHRAWIRSLVFNGYTFLSGSELSVDGKTAKELTKRELEILQQIAFGYSSKEIAERLFLSIHTITNHRKKMLNRSNCNNCAELVRIAISENLL